MITATAQVWTAHAKTGRIYKRIVLDPVWGIREDDVLQVEIFVPSFRRPRSIVTITALPVRCGGGRGKLTVNVPVWIPGFDEIGKCVDVRITLAPPLVETQAEA